jgi:hypothetical protein
VAPPKRAKKARRPPLPTGYAKARTLSVPVMRDELRHLGRTYVPGGGNGTIFELTRSGGMWTKQVIYSGAPGYAGLAMDAAGNIFGVATDIVFELSPNGQGGWNPTVIHTFSGGPTDGVVGEGTPLLDHAGNLYGTTLGGGSKEPWNGLRTEPWSEWMEREDSPFFCGRQQ